MHNIKTFLIYVIFFKTPKLFYIHVNKKFKVGDFIMLFLCTFLDFYNGSYVIGMKKES